MVIQFFSAKNKGCDEFGKKISLLYVQTKSAKLVNKLCFFYGKTEFTFFEIPIFQAERDCKSYRPYGVMYVPSLSLSWRTHPPNPPTPTPLPQPPPQLGPPHHHTPPAWHENLMDGWGGRPLRWLSVLVLVMPSHPPGSAPRTWCRESRQFPSLSLLASCQEDFSSLDTDAIAPIASRRK